MSSESSLPQACLIHSGQQLPVMSNTRCPARPAYFLRDLILIPKCLLIYSLELFKKVPDISNQLMIYKNSTPTFLPTKLYTNILTHKYDSKYIIKQLPSFNEKSFRGLYTSISFTNACIERT